MMARRSSTGADRRRLGDRKHHRPWNHHHRSSITSNHLLSLSLFISLSLSQNFRWKQKWGLRVAGLHSCRLTCSPSRFWSVPLWAPPAKPAILRLTKWWTNLALQQVFTGQTCGQGPWLSSLLRRTLSLLHFTLTYFSHVRKLLCVKV